ncbi:MAG: proline--tRNA ligase [Anaerolineae bacterium]
MRIQELFGHTLREAPADAEMVSHQYALRAGLVRMVAGGIYAWLPLGLRVLRRVEAIVRAEMEAAGAQEMRLPVVQPAEIRQQTGRWAEGFEGELLKFQNRDGRHYVLGATAEDVLAAVAAHEIDSYRDLPRLLYQVQTKFRDTARPRGGLVRLREFVMKDAYSLDRTADALEETYHRMQTAYERIFARLGLSVVALEADAGAMGGQFGHEYALPHPEGEDTFARCPHCGLAANVDATPIHWPDQPPAEPAPLEKVATPDCKTIEAVAAFVGVPTAQTLKAVFFMRDEAEFVFVVIRGDLEVNEAKLRRALGGGTLRAATEDEIRAVGAEPGYASPIGLDVRGEGAGAGVTVIADRSIQTGGNFVVGANDAGYHYTGANYPRDFAVTRLADIATPAGGMICGRCAQGALTLDRAIELAHCFKLGTRYSEALGVTFLDESGVARPVVMGSYGIGLDRLVAAVIERHHDDYGIIWPRSIAPFDVHLVTLGKDDAIHAQGRALADALEAAGLAVLLDDRAERPGVKFADADLIGVPLRVTVSERALARDALEGKWRHSPERFDIPAAEGAAAILRLVRGE